MVRAAGWHATEPGSILGKDGLYTFKSEVYYDVYLYRFLFGCNTPALSVCFGVDIALYKTL
jgi:hypothetical protein